MREIQVPVARWPTFLGHLFRGRRPQNLARWWCAPRMAGQIGGVLLFRRVAGSRQSLGTVGQLLKEYHYHPDCPCCALYRRKDL